MPVEYVWHFLIDHVKTFYLKKKIHWEILFLNKAMKKKSLFIERWTVVTIDFNPHKKSRDVNASSQIILSVNWKINSVSFPSQIRRNHNKFGLYACYYCSFFSVFAARSAIKTLRSVPRLVIAFFFVFFVLQLTW